MGDLDGIGLDLGGIVGAFSYFFYSFYFIKYVSRYVYMCMNNLPSVFAYVYIWSLYMYVYI